jgi:thiaminase/transcriptional activator TenA
MELHRGYMAGFGITREEMNAAKPSLYNRTYTANMLSVGQMYGLPEIIATVFPCAWTYADYARRLKVQYADKYESNFYKSWIDNYANDEFEKSFGWFYDSLDSMVSTMTIAECDQIAEIFISSVEFEYLFWDMSYKREMSYKL